MPSDSVPCPCCGFPASASRLAPPLPLSPCPELRRSNAAPLETQYPEIDREIAAASNSIAFIDERIRYLQPVLVELAARRQALQDFVTDHKRVLAPIRKVPSDVLSEIFLWCAARDSDDVWDPSTDPEWVLAQVCRYWRALALATPRIWRRVFITHHYFLHYIQPAALSLQLERSAEAPLAIAVMSRFPDDDARNRILDCLFPVAHRWQDVEIHLLPSDVNRFLAHNYSTSFPALTTLSLLFRTFEGEDSTLFETIFQSTPVLEALSYASSLDVVDESTLLRIHVFPLSQLRKLTLKSQWYGAASISKVFRSASEVVELLLDSCWNVGRDITLEPDTLASPETLPHLRTLSLCGGDPSILDHMTAPILSNLSITAQEFDEGAVLPTALISFLTRTPTAGASLIITHLTLSDIWMSTEELLAILNLTPHVSSLVLEFAESTVDVHLMQALTLHPGPATGNLVPRITYLHLGWKFTCGPAALADMLGSRCAPGAGCLRSVRLQDWPSSPEDLPAFETLLSRGLEISLVVY
ncbi:hypothetical protein B0H11DRAFT_1369042 [Mycena galericulata]|nr:hypothetical protein B0H11DRAFT_1369042 [Mycena galericulata]